MGDDERRVCGHRGLDELLASAVKVARRLVEDEDSRRLQDGYRYRQRPSVRDVVADRSGEQGRALLDDCQQRRYERRRKSAKV